ncbi:hypothetical protein [Oceanicoccus sp. KOV_DT_Chl]|uniref:hypothetical protein n=1 Tax=Oceanicoccus sp. KOV_DT_Chl TaxID=1904639 RepID=UPI0011AFBFCF|nr:hypothetical protein [Oceanicoccus sp. KOV_DT_Chl]
MNTDNLRMATLVLLILCVGLYFYTGEQQDFYDRHAKPVAENMLQELSQWRREALLKYLSDEARQTLTESQINKLLDHYRQFGQLKSIDDLEFSRLASALSLFGRAHINYRSDASFSGGRAHINITLTPAPSGYKIYNFSINKI